MHFNISDNNYCSNEFIITAINLVLIIYFIKQCILYNNIWNIYVLYWYYVKLLSGIQSHKQAWIPHLRKIIFSVSTLQLNEEIVIKN